MTQFLPAVSVQTLSKRPVIGPSDLANLRRCFKACAILPVADDPDLLPVPLGRGPSER